jgi:DNA repair photolyase
MHFREVKGILSAARGMNISRGCVHGCIYCDARSACYRMEHDFEDVEIKINAPLLLDDALARARKRCMVVTGAMSDPYIPLRENLSNIRSCLAVIERHGCGVAIQTKSGLILRDLPLLRRINEKAKCVIATTLTTFDESLCAIIEPGVCGTGRRFEMLNVMRSNGIKTIVWLSPFLPFINDTEKNIRRLLEYCVQARVYGVMCFGIGLTLREGNREYFYRKLDEHFPGLKKTYQKKYGLNYVIASENNNTLMSMIYETCARHNVVCNNDALFAYMGTFEEQKGQMEMF